MVSESANFKFRYSVRIKRQEGSETEGRIFLSYNYNIWNMMLIKMRYIAFAAFVSVLFGCNKGVEPQPDTQPDVYLAVTARAAHTNGEESINMDMEDLKTVCTVSPC